MNMHRIFALTLVAAAVLAGCNTAPVNQALLDEARNDYGVAQANPQTRELAGGELKQAGDALAKADQAAARGDRAAEVNSLAYMAKQRVAIAHETAKQKSSEQAISEANASRDKLRLAARTIEVDSAQRSAELAQRQAATSQQQASESQTRNAVLEAQLKELDARKTERGMVITIGDVLFDTDQAQLKAGGMRSMQKLVVFFKNNPQRRAMVEGFTDSTGSDSHNQELSGRRANAVRTALLDLGVGGDRVTSHGYGESHPVASNDSAGGRQLNRRVEIVLSDDSGTIAPR